MRRTRPIVLAVFLSTITSGSLSGCKNRTDSGLYDTSVGHSWWTTVTTELNDAVGKTDSAKVANDGLVAAVTNIQATPASARTIKNRTDLQAQIETARAQLTQLMTDVGQALDQLKTTLAAGSSADIQKGEKSIRNIPDSRPINLTINGVAVTRDWGFKGITTEAERIQNELAGQVVQQIRGVALLGTDDANVARSLAQANAISAAIATARIDVAYLAQGVRSWFDPTTDDYDSCNPLGAGPSFIHTDCRWKPTVALLHLLGPTRPCGFTLDADQPGSTIYDQGQPSSGHQPDFDGCSNNHLTLKTNLSKTLENLAQNQATESWVDSRDGKTYDVTGLINLFNRKPMTVSVDATATALAYDFNGNNLTVPFSLLNSDMSAALASYFQISSGASGATGTVPVAAAGVQDWAPLPTAAQLADLMSGPKNDPNDPSYVGYADYRDGAPPAKGLGLPGQVILAAMRASAANHQTGNGGANSGTRDGCLTTVYAPHHWSDIMLHYYCLMLNERSCYTTTVSAGGPRPDAYKACAAGTVPPGDDSTEFAWVVDPANSPQDMVFQYLMYSQTFAFPSDQQQIIINTFYGVTPDPATGAISAAECAKRPLRSEDPTNGTACNLTGKVYLPKLEGKGR